MSNVLIADDHDVVFMGLSVILKNHFQEIRKLTDVNNLLEEVRRTPPCILIVDIEFNGQFSLNKVMRIRDEFPDIKIIVYTSYGSLSMLGRFLEIKVDGFILKSTPMEEVKKGVEQVLSGKRYLDSESAGKLLDMVSVSGDRLNTLSAREFEFFIMLAQGLSYDEISKKTFVTVNTVGSYRTRIAEKLGLSTREQLTTFAKFQGIIKE